MLMTKTDVFNEVRRILGHTRAISDADSAQEPIALAIRRVWETQLMLELRSYEWKYYLSRTPLQLFKEHPTKDWKFAYSYPNKAAAILAVTQEDFIADYSFSRPNLMNRFSIERWDPTKQVIYSHVRKAWAVIIEIPEANEGFDVNMGMSLAARIALAIAPEMITNNYFAIKDKLKEDCDQQISNAQANDAQQTPQREPQYAQSLAIRDAYDY